MEVFKLNKIIKEDLHNQNLDFAHILNTHINGKISVIIKHQNKDYIGLDQNLNETSTSSISYYGASPKLDNEKIINAISNFSLRNHQQLNQFISENHKLFTLHKHQEGYVLSLSKYIILQYSKNFGIRFYIENKELLEKLKDTSYKNILEIQENIITIKGCPTDEIIYLFDKHQFHKNTALNAWEISHTPVSIRFENIYQQKENIQLLNGTVFYSGVVLRPLSISHFDNLYENTNIDHYKIVFENSTFATVYALDQPLFEHPLLTGDMEKIKQFLNHDNKVTLQLIEELNQLEENKSPIEYLNNYLSLTYGVNQICVAANVITKDDKLILSQRSSGSIDQKLLYAGVNGNAEVCDNDVLFYQNSVYEDYPTIKLTDQRLDLVGEISRETKAELSLITSNSDWDCVGLVLMGKTPTQSIHDYRRMHFALIFETHTSYTFQEIKTMGQNATESFENEKLLGVLFNIYRSKWDWVYQNILNLLEKIFESKDFLETLILVVMAILNSDTKWIFGNSLFMNIINVIIIVLILSKIIQWGKNYQNNQKNTIKINLIQTKEFRHTLLKDFKQYLFHPVALMSYYIHVSRKINQSSHK